MDDNNSNKNNIDSKNLLEEYIKENNKLKDEIEKLIEENNLLKNDLQKANYLIKNNTDYIIPNLINTIKEKEKEIKDLKIQLIKSQNKSIDFDNLLIISFSSNDSYISNYAIKCRKTDTFAVIEEKLYQEYPQYRNTHNSFLVKGNVILRFKRMDENDIKDGDKILLIRHD